MKKANKKIYWEPTLEAPSRIIPPLKESLPMPERIILHELGHFVMNKKEIDLEKLSEEDLVEIKKEIEKRLAKKLNKNKNK